MLQISLTITLVALLIEAAVGYPRALFNAVGHPVTWIGTLIDRLERRLNQATMPEGRRRLNGVLTLLAVMGLTILLGWAVQVVLLSLPWGTGLTGLVTSSLLAQRSLDTHVGAVSLGLRQSGLDGGRTAVAMIVGRNPQSLDENGVARAAIESLAENFSDGIVAPLFWGALAGLPAMAGYKAINTLDSMIGHKTSRYKAFGWASARFDDLVNLPASRLAALWLVLAALITGEDWRGALRAIGRDARHHRSPNAGWPEAAMAGGLGLRLAGPRTYGDTQVDDVWMGDGRTAATAGDIDRALKLYRVALGLEALALAILWLIPTAFESDLLVSALRTLP